MQRTDPSTFKPVDTNGDGVPDAVTGTPFSKAQNVIEIGGNSLAAVVQRQRPRRQPGALADLLDRARQVQADVVPRRSCRKSGSPTSRRSRAS